MSTVTTRTSASAEAGAALPAHSQRLWTVIVAHGVIDWLSAVVVPILTYLEGRVHMTPAQGAMLIAVGSISSGIIQPLVALVSDKHDTRWAGTLGLLAAAGAMGSIGFAQDFHHLLILQIIGTAGIGAFHPVGAAAAGQLAAGKRGSVISVFYAAGLAGGVLGSFTMPRVVHAFDLKALAWAIGPCVLFALLLAWAIHAVPHRHARAHEHHSSLPDQERRRRWRDVSLLFAANALRFIVNMMLVQLIKRWCEARVLGEHGVSELTPDLRLASSGINGPIQGMMALGMGVSGLALGRLAPLRHAKAVLFLTPLAGVVAIALFPSSGSLGVAWALAAMMGLGYAAVMPLTITMGQRLLPHRTGLASALMMGGAWTLAAAGPPVAQGLLAEGWSLRSCFVLVAALLLASAFLALPLGEVPPESHERG